MSNTENLPQINDEYCLKEFGWTKSQFQVVQNTYFKGMTIDDIKIFGHVCKHTGLDPFLKQIYPVMRQGKLTIQTAIDGYRAIAERTGRYSPGKEPTFIYDKSGDVFSSTAYVKKMTSDGTWHDVAATAYFKEYNPGVGPFWKKMPHAMISKCAEALALRKAFPEQLSGVYTKEEMDQADKEEKLDQMDYEEIRHNPETVKTFTMETPVTRSNEKITLEQLNQIMVGMDKMPEDVKENYKKYMKTTWSVTEYEDLPSAAFDLTMKAIDRVLKTRGSNANN